LRFLVGCDPEVFLINGQGEFIAAGEVGIPGTKRKPYPLEKGACQVDGLALEFNIDPAETPEEFDKNISTVLKQLDEIVEDKGGKSLRITFAPYAEFDPIYFALLDYKSKQLGCDPDYDHHGNMKTPDAELTIKPIRTAGGHVHLGFTEDEDPMEPKHFLKCVNLSQASLKRRFFTPRTPMEKARCEHYAVSGSFRPKHYGMEFRTPSNLWVSRPRDRKEIFSITKKLAEATL
jgi:hypothetical protein